MRFNMTEITIKIPEGIPLPLLKKKIDNLIKEEEIRWTLFEKSRDEILLSPEELNELEKIRGKAWKETRKKYDL
jgi:hypothetical protein